MTPDERARAGEAETSALEPGRTGHGEPLEAGAFTFEEYEARARAERDGHRRRDRKKTMPFMSGVPQIAIVTERHEVTPYRGPLCGKVTRTTHGYCRTVAAFHVRRAERRSAWAA